MTKAIDKAGYIYTNDEIAKCLIKNHGNLHGTALELSLTRKTLQERIRRNPDLQVIVGDARDEFIDVAEKGLYAHVEKGSISAIQFTLRTIGKVRGWGESPQVVNVNQNANIDMSKLEKMPMEERLILDELLRKLNPDEDIE